MIGSLESYSHEHIKEVVGGFVAKLFVRGLFSVHGTWHWAVLGLK